MYPARELIRLAAHKRAVQRRITGHRADCVAAATSLAQPFAWLDRALGFWRQLSPWIKIAAVPLGLFWKRPAAVRPLGALLRWLPVVTAAVRGFNALRSR
jgi:hypothetical protein